EEGLWTKQVMDSVSLALDYKLVR
ncbi:hypothetical protein A2U01_0012733, partial [Trifolium medium]|nr:hypothetical protein [Trifolium medium]